MMPAEHRVRVETELAAIMPASHTRYLFPLAPVVGEPLRYEEAAALAAPSERSSTMAKFNVTLLGLSSNELAEITAILEEEVGGSILEKVSIAPVFA
jgi:hypothetical protein